MATRRSYCDRCGVARALDLVGERWALLVVRELLLGPKRFTDLRAGLPNLSPDVLSQRLRELEQAGLVRRHKLAPPAASRVYELTERGEELEPVVLALGRWGCDAPPPTADAVLGADSAILGLKVLYTPSAAEGIEASYELRLGEYTFHARVSNGQLDLSRGAADHPDAILETDPATLSRLVWHSRSLAEAERSGEIKLHGNRTAARDFLELFAPPEPAAATDNR